MYSVYNILFFAARPLCFPGSWSASGDALLGPCSECLVGFYQVKNIYFSRSNINGVTGERNIADMWQDHYKSMQNSVKKAPKNYLCLIRLTISEENLLFFPLQRSLLHLIFKKGKSCGVDGLAAELSRFVHPITHVFLSLLFN